MERKDVRLNMLQRDSGELEEASLDAQGPHMSYKAGQRGGDAGTAHKSTAART